MKQVILFVVLLVTFVPAVSAQVELTPFAAWRWGGTIEYDESELFSTDVSVAESPAYGLIVGFPLSRNFLFELSVSRQQSEFESDEGLFEDEVALADVDVTYYQAGVAFEFDSRSARPYIGLSLGGATIDPDLANASSENRFAASLGGGVKFDLAPHVGLRFDARMYSIFLDTSNDEWDDCYQCYDYDEGDTLTQGEVSAGLTFWF